ncbi:Skp1 family, tetramerization domain-containing protein [Scheffersomyces coipomensis]|uniref:Skp1 family, tetramerization domain-containing protein n=1 Tax=Scheffersomyces coipomensis TaxID=1788519 RepID=UPI00315D6EFB
MAESRITLISSDDDKFPVDQEVAERSITIKNVINDFNEEDEIEVPLANVDSVTLTRVLEWCEHHKDSVFPDEDDEDAKKTAPIEEWDRTFLRVDQQMLFNIILASNYLNIPPLRDSACKLVSEMIQSKSPDQLKAIFNREQVNGMESQTSTSTVVNGSS